MVLIKKGFTGNAEYSYILSEKKICSRGVDPHPLLIGDMSHKKQSFFDALTNWKVTGEGIKKSKCPTSMGVY